MDSPRDAVRVGAATAPGASFVAPSSSPTHPVTPLATAALASAPAAGEPKAPSALRWYHVVGIAVGVTLVVAGIALAILVGVGPGVLMALSGLAILAGSAAKLYDAKTTANRKLLTAQLNDSMDQDLKHFEAFEARLREIFGNAEEERAFFYQARDNVENSTNPEQVLAVFEMEWKLRFAANELRDKITLMKDRSKYFDGSLSTLSEELEELNNKYLKAPIIMDVLNRNEVLSTNNLKSKDQERDFKTDLGLYIECVQGAVHNAHIMVRLAKENGKSETASALRLGRHAT